jgi:WD40 repeat protein
VHESSISCLTLSSDGTFLAATSDKGTLIRILKAEDGTFLQEVRRGAEKAEIYSLAFDPTTKFIACSSDRGTVHIFSLTTAHKKLKEGSNDDEGKSKEKEEEIVEPKNQKSL